MRRKKRSSEYVFVHSYYRRRGVAKPHWIAMKVVVEGAGEYQFLSIIPKRGFGGPVWNNHAHVAQLYMKRELTKQFKQEIKDKTVILFKVD